MPINLSVSDADFVPYLKYNAKAGRFYVRPQGATNDVEVVNPRLAFDMAGVKTGWIYFAEGSGPEKVWDPSPSQMAPKPPGPRKFKRGFEVLVFGNDDIRGVGKLGLREFASTASNVIAAFLKMHAAFEAGMKANPGKVPFYVCKSVIPVPGSYGTNYEPEFELKGWVDRAKIPEFDEREERAGASGNGADHEMAGFGDRNPPPPSAADLDDDIPF